VKPPQRVMGTEQLRTALREHRRFGARVQRMSPLSRPGEGRPARARPGLGRPAHVHTDRGARRAGAQFDQVTHQVDEPQAMAAVVGAVPDPPG